MRIAVVGAGVSGLVASHVLSAEHAVTVFEADDRIGGHTHTVDVEAADGTHAVDTGFIVFNPSAYPQFCRLLDRLGVASQPSSMSLSIHSEISGRCYGTSDLPSVLAQPSNLLRPSFLRMFRDLFRFHRVAPALLSANGPSPGLTLGEYVASEGLSDAFVEDYLLPMAGAIWSTDAEGVRRMPARFLVEFFRNHSLLDASTKEWRVVAGGSRSYLAPLVAPFRDRIRTSTPVRAIRRDPDGVTIEAAGHEGERFDRVVLACHSDQALRMLADPSDAEQEILGAIAYQPNDVVLHTDTALLPPARRAWSSWNCHVPRESPGRATVTYDMNILQGLEARDEYCVTLNRSGAIDPGRVLGRYDYAHPVYTFDTLAAHRRRDEIDGVRRTHYCGAYWGNGFHEDGVVSALRVASAFGLGLAGGAP